MFSAIEKMVLVDLTVFILNTLRLSEVTVSHYICFSSTDDHINCKHRDVYRAASSQLYKHKYRYKHKVTQ